ncbi:hypothetical protein PVL29_008932 [Vitis rotundifolia]|uniref:TOM1-like protein 2 n=1 Tax=Vitis rotundifolia TaxID=103349 RepID=A0AA39DWV2_VITRO|nr:hypothetical protein PVL29_008932 [Vitis rotundifolia]
MQILNLYKVTNSKKLQAQQMRFAGHSLVLLHISYSLPSASSEPSSHHQWRASRAWNHEGFSSLLSGEEAQRHGFYLFFLVSRFGMVTPTGAGVSMDPGAGETVDRNGACSLGHLGYGFRLHPVAPSLPANQKPPSQSALSSLLKKKGTKSSYCPRTWGRRESQLEASRYHGTSWLYTPEARPRSTLQLAPATSRTTTTISFLAAPYLILCPCGHIVCNLSTSASLELSTDSRINTLGSGPIWLDRDLAMALRPLELLDFLLHDLLGQQRQRREKMDKLKLASLGERLKTGGAQMGRMVSGKVKEILQTPTPESKMVDEATSESLLDPNWGMNLRICAMINSEEFSGAEIVRAIKKKISSKNVMSQRLSLDLLEVCSMNCEKVFSEVASEKLLDDMVRMIDNPQTDHTNKERALQLIQAWGESEDLAYLPVFRQTYMSLKRNGTPPQVQDGSSPPIPYSLESYVHQQPQSPPGSYPIPDAGLHSADSTTFSYNYGILSTKEKKEFLLITRNSLELLSSILDSETEPKPIKDDLTVSMVEKCKQSQPVVQRIVESTINDEGMLFEALYLHDELQQVISKYEEMEAKSSAQLPENPNTAGGNSAEPVELNEAKTAESPKGESSEASNDQKST